MPSRCPTPLVLDAPAPVLLPRPGRRRRWATPNALPDIAPPPPAPGGPDLAYGAFQRGFYLTAFDIAIERAQAGDVPAQTLIALIYEGGYGVPQDFAKAFEWFRLAADAGDREAQFALGMMYMQGRGVARTARSAPTTSRRPRTRARSTRCTISA